MTCLFGVIRILFVFALIGFGLIGMHSCNDAVNQQRSFSAAEEAEWDKETAEINRRIMETTSTVNI